MKSKSVVTGTLCLAVLVSLSACKKEFSAADGAPSSPQVVPTGDMSLVTVDKPDQFPLVTAETAEGSAELKATGAVFPDVSREVPVITLANGPLLSKIAAI